MSRIYYGSKTLTDDCFTIPIAFLRKHGYLKHARSGSIVWTRSGMWGESKSSMGIQSHPAEKKVRFCYTQTDRNTGKKNDMNYQINLTTTPCHFGGERYWFVCGLSKGGTPCGRRVGTLYLAPGAKWLGCRHCLDLTYDSKMRSGWTKGLCVHDTYTLEKMRQQVKKKTYKGKLSKKYKRFLAAHNKYLDDIELLENRMMNGL